MHNAASKYMDIGEDLLVIFPHVEEGVCETDASIRHLIYEQEQWLRIGHTMLVPLNDDIMLLLQRSGTAIVLAESENYEFKISLKGHILINPLLVGKLMVYYEMGKERLAEEAALVPVVAIEESLDQDYIEMGDNGTSV